LDRRERFENSTVAFRAALRGWQAQLWTAIPGIYQGPGSAGGKQTANVQPAIQALVQNEQGVWSPVTMPLCVDCPILFPGGGGFQLTFPLSQGDEGLLVFASRCIDAWWQSGGVQAQAEIRMHDLSDGFFLPGQLSQPKVPASFSTSTTRLTSLDGELYIELASGHVANIVAPGGVNISGTLSVTGAITATGNITAGSGGGDQVDMQNHTHGGVQTGGSQTSRPTAGT
jgi:hypothetical protein